MKKRARILVALGLFVFSAYAYSNGKYISPEQPVPNIVRGMGTRMPDVPAIRNWGVNVIRVFAPQVNVASMKPDLQKLLDMGGVKVVIVGRMGGYDWSKPDVEQRLVDEWKNIATTFLPYRDIIWGYDLVCEPLDNKQLPYPPKQWRGIAIKVIEAIRTIDDKTWIIYEPGPSGRFAGFKNLEPLPDKRVIYSAHYYFPHEFTHVGINRREDINVKYPVKISDLNGTDWGMKSIFQGPPLRIPAEKCTAWDKDFQKLILQPTVEFQRKYNVPIFVGEFSTVRWGDKESSIRYLREAIEIFEEYGWSWSYFSYNGFTGWNPEQSEGPESYWFTGMTNPVPSPTETQRAKLLKDYYKRNGSEDYTYNLKEVKDNSKDRHLFQNENSERLKLLFSSNNKGKVTVNVISVNSTVVKSLSYHKVDVRFETEINIADLNPGIYLIEVQENGTRLFCDKIIRL